MKSYILYALLPLVSTFIGGYVVFRWKRDLHPWLSLSGGILLGVAFLDLLPEAFESGLENGISAFALGSMSLAAIIFFHLVDKLFGSHHHDHAHSEPAEPCQEDRHKHLASWMRTGGIILHTFLDGVAVGTGFAANQALGMLILFAVVAHDFSDGMSTVTILKRLKHHDRGILMILAIHALSPFVGVFVGLKFALDEKIVSGMLAVFAGFFITLALSELLPQAHAGETRRFGLVLTLLGIGIVVILRAIAPV